MRPASGSARAPIALAVSLGLCIAGMAIWFGGLSGLLYLALFSAAVATGLPIGWRLFGRHHPAGWVAGGLTGYGLTTLAFWAPIRLGIPHPLAFGAAWVLLLLAVWRGIRPGRVPMVALPQWTRRDALAWLLVLHLVPALLAVPLGHVGARHSSGARFYRAYFTADFVWHLTVLNELRQFEAQPRDPFLAREPIHYYWTYFVVPAVLSGPVGLEVVPAPVVLKANATMMALLLLSMIYFGARGAARESWSAAAGTALVFLAASWEGSYALLELARTGGSLDSLRDLNIDAITAWTFQGLRIDGLVRTMWYTPQHALSLALGLVAVLAVQGASSPRLATGWLCGVALGLSVTVNPFLGGALCLVYGMAVTADVVSGRASLRALLGQGVAVIPVVVAVGWCLFNQMNDPAGGGLTIGPVPGTRHWGLCLLLSFGGALGVAVLGLYPWRGVDWRPVVPGAAALGIALLMMHFVSLSDRSWVGFRAGNLMLATMPVLAARAFDRLRAGAGRRAAALAFTVFLASGLPTTLIDAYNAQDIRNLREGPGFPWTIVHTPAQEGGFAWIRGQTAPTAIVQADPIVRDRRNWCLMPAFASRRMAGGLPISLLPKPDYQRISNEVHALMAAPSAGDAHRRAQALGIDYLWFDGDDGPSGAAAVDRLAALPDLFSIRYRRADVAILEVR